MLRRAEVRTHQDNAVYNFSLTDNVGQIPGQATLQVRMIPGQATLQVKKIPGQTTLQVR